jgi:hypothetical protein
MLLSPDESLESSDLFAVTFDRLKAFRYARNAKGKKLFYNHLG